MRFNLKANISNINWSFTTSEDCSESSGSLLLNGHQNMEDWPKNAGARARNVKAGLKTI